jgi:hypothetical protein
MPLVPRVPPAPDVGTSLIYGGWRAGKTWLNLTYPRPAWIGSRREEGYTTYQYMDPADWYEPPTAANPAGVEPLAFTVQTKREMLDHVNNDIKPLIKSGRIKTLVLELSYYTNDIVNAAGNSTNGYEKWQMLQQHIEWFDTHVKQLGCRLAYNALAKASDDAKVPGGIVIAGQALQKLPAGVSLVGYLRTEERKVGSGIDRILHLQSYGPFMAGHRFGNRLPGIIRNPTYRKLEELLAGRMVVDAVGNVVTPEELAAQAAPKAPLGGKPPLGGRGRLRLVGNGNGINTTNGDDLPPLGDGGGMGGDDLPPLGGGGSDLPPLIDDGSDLPPL